MPASGSDGFVACNGLMLKSCSAVEGKRCTGRLRNTTICRVTRFFLKKCFYKIDRPGFQTRFTVSGELSFSIV